MEIQSKIMKGGDRFSDLPKSILIHILSMLSEAKEVVRTSLLSTRWRSLWMSVPVSLFFQFSYSNNEKAALDFMASTNRELHYWRFCDKIRRFSVRLFKYRKQYVKDVDLWVHYATKVTNVEGFKLEFYSGNDYYEFPQFAYKNTSLKNLVLWHCQLKPCGSVNWSSLVSLKIGGVKLADGAIEKVLSGCPKLECLKLNIFSGIHHLEISNAKLRKLIIEGSYNKNHHLWLEILASFIQYLKLRGPCCEIRMQQRNVHSLVTAVLDLYFDF